MGLLLELRIPIHSYVLRDTTPKVVIIDYIHALMEHSMTSLVLHTRDSVNLVQLITIIHMLLEIPVCPVVLYSPKKVVIRAHAEVRTVFTRYVKRKQTRCLPVHRDLQPAMTTATPRATPS